VKRFFWFYSLLVVIFTACSSSGSSSVCEQGICVRIEIEGPVQALEPARYIIFVKTEKDISKLPIGLSVLPGITISNVEKIPENATLVYQDKTLWEWQINTKGGEEYSFTGYIILSEPTVSYGIFSYSVFAFFSQPTFGQVTDSVMIYLDAEGKQVEESQAKMELETVFPAPTPRPDMTVVPETPWPTVVWPTETLPASPSPTFPPYP
jgi:hypothetical protein